jgi:hypothetical protein
MSDSALKQVTAWSDLFMTKDKPASEDGVQSSTFYYNGVSNCDKVDQYPSLLQRLKSSKIRWKFKFEFLDGQEELRWWPNQMPPNYEAGPLVTKECEHCHLSFYHVFSDGWRCLNVECSFFWMVCICWYKGTAPNNLFFEDETFPGHVTLHS